MQAVSWLNLPILIVYLTIWFLFASSKHENLQMLNVELCDLQHMFALLIQPVGHGEILETILCLTHLKTFEAKHTFLDETLHTLLWNLQMYDIK